MLDGKIGFEQALCDYVMRKPLMKDRKFVDECTDEFPEKDWPLPPETWSNNLLSYVFFEKVLPSGKTFAEEFADARGDISPELNASIPALRSPIRSNFIVLSKKGRVLFLKDVNTGAKYDVETVSGSPAQANDVIEGRIALFGRGYWFMGALLIKRSPMILDPEVLFTATIDSQIERYESFRLHPNSSLSAILNKYPFQWVDGIYLRLKLSGDRLKKGKLISIERRLMEDMQGIIANLPEESRKALSHVLSKGGLVKYGELKGYTDKIGFWWNEKPSEQNSALGLLRTHGLLAIGRMNIGGKSFRTAFVPSDLRDCAKAALEGMKK